MPKHPSEDYDPPYADPPTDMTPLAIILTLMRQRFDDQDMDGAVALARIAAPYIHPRVTATTPQADLAAMPDADLDAIRPQD